MNPTAKDTFVSLFERLSPDQQADILQIMETWVKMPPVPQPAQSGDSTAAPPRTIPELSKELHCLNALKKVVEDHYQPRVELAYIAFHPDLDSVSTAKTREAAKKMYTLEAAYELKSIFEQNPDSEILEKEIVETLQRYLHL